jgi:hypothetical protein
MVVFIGIHQIIGEYFVEGIVAALRQINQLQNWGGFAVVRRRLLKADIG